MFACFKYGNDMIPIIYSNDEVIKEEVKVARDIKNGL